MKPFTFNPRGLFSCISISILCLACFTYSTAGTAFIDIGKINWSLIAVGIAFLLIAIYGLPIWESPLKYIKWTGVDLFVLIWLFCLSVSTLIIKADFSREQYLTLVIGILCFMISRQVIFNYRKAYLSSFLFFVALFTMIQCIIGVLQFFSFIHSLNSFFRVTGTFKNPAPLALFLSTCLPLIYYAFDITSKALLKFFFGFNLLLCLFVICISGNRASFIAIAIVLAFYAGLSISRHSSYAQRLKHGLVKPMLLLVVIGMVLLGGYYLYQLKPVSADGRLLIWKIAWYHIFDYPLSGAGLGSFQANYIDWQALYFASNADFRSQSGTAVSDIAGYVRLAYNEYLEIILEQGIIGFLLFIGVIYYSIKLSWPAVLRHRKSFALPALAALFTILIQSFFSYPLHSLPSIILTFTLVAFLTSEAQNHAIGGNRKPSAISFLFLFIAALTLTAGVTRIRNYNAYSLARLLFNSDRERSALIFDNISTSLNHDPGFLIDYSISLAAQKNDNAAILNLNKAMRIDGDPQIVILLGDCYARLGKFDLAEKSYKKASLMVPSLLYPRYALVKLLVKNHRVQEARTIAFSILNRKIKVANDQTEKIIEEMKLFVSAN